MCGLSEYMYLDIQSLNNECVKANFLLSVLPIFYTKSSCYDSVFSMFSVCTSMRFYAKLRGIVAPHCLICHNVIHAVQ